jgi:two-component system sensor histidine kinase KdpD
VLAYLVLVLGATPAADAPWASRSPCSRSAASTSSSSRPYHTFAVAEPLDWLVLGAFLVTSGIAAQLLARAQREAAEARQRASEIDRLAALGAEALNAARAEDALEAVADVIRTSVAVTRCEVYLRRATPEGVRLAAASGPGGPPNPAGRGGEATPPARGGNTEREEWAPGVPGPERLVEWVARNGRPAVTRADGTLGWATCRRSRRRVPRPARRRGASDGPPAGFDPRWRPDPAACPSASGTGPSASSSCSTQRGSPSTPPAAGCSRRSPTTRPSRPSACAWAAEAEHADALRQADRLKDALLASVSHDLRTPLTTIKALAHDIGVSGDERAVIIEEEADRLNRFVADLLDLSRLAGGALTVTPEFNTADDLVGAALQRVAGATEGRVIDVALDASEPLLVGRFDFSHALRIVANLLENAVKYSPDDGPVDLVVTRAAGLAGTPGWLEVSVADRGVGVPPDERDRIFAPFYRPAGSPPDAGSAGLGLSIARQLAEAQGGTLHCEPRPGGGEPLRPPPAGRRPR